MKRLAAVSFAVASLFSCAEKKATNKFSDPVLAIIADFQDRRLSDSLYQFLRSPRAAYRAEASLAFASIQDTLASARLGNLLLEDPDAAVRINAAFALGQTGGIGAVNALIPAVDDHSSAVVREVLEALGKTIQGRDLSILVNYKPKDTLTTEGLSWGIYRLALRKLADSAMVAMASEWLDTRYNFQTRLAAAHFFNRVQFSGNYYEKKIITAALEDPAPEVRMAVLGGLKKMDPARALETLSEIIRSEKDQRVRNSAVRACSNFSFKESQDLVARALTDPSVAVQISASELILKGAKEGPVKKLDEKLHASKNIRVKANLYGALLSAAPDDKPVQEIMDLYRQSDDYGKAWLLTALSFSQGANEMAALNFLSSSISESKSPVIKSTAAQGMVTMNYHADFFKGNKARFSELYKKAIADGDPAVTGIIAGALADSTLGYRTIIHDVAFLLQAKQKLQLPKDIESLQPLIEAIAYLEGQPKPPPVKNVFNHPMDWKIIKSIKGDQRVAVNTTKGDIILRLYVEEAPGSVANFVALVNGKYFDGKFFHRVVPNFVVQTGCNRGDGFGSEEYSIRSEFSKRRYTTGSVGMASAGKDTEGTQWFITHSPTPHLDGRYTVYAEVVTGQEWVDQIEVGDSIVSVRLIP